MWKQEQDHNKPASVRGDRGNGKSRSSCQIGVAKFYLEGQADVRPVGSVGSAVSGSHPDSAAAHQTAEPQPIHREHAVLSRGGQARSSEA